MLFRWRVVLPLLAVLIVALIGGIASAAPPPAPYVNGFEQPGDAGGPSTDDATLQGATRVGSGTNGISSATGNWHAVAPVNDFGLPGGNVFTRYGGYSSVFPVAGYNTSMDVYFDTGASVDDVNLRLDWSSAISNPAGAHRRDFIFSAGRDGAGGWAVSASNNAPGWPLNPARDPLSGLATGWYTLEHRFYDAGAGVLAVDMTVRNAQGNALKSWTLSDPTDVIGTTVGGNRYGWLVTNDFPNLPLDNLTRSGATPQSKSDCKNGGWESLGRADGTTFKNQGDCIKYVKTLQSDDDDNENGDRDEDKDHKGKSKTVTVTARDLGRHWFVADSRSPGTGVFELGAGTPPAGRGSFELATTVNAAKVQLLTDLYDGTRLADIDGIGYSTFRDPGSTGFVAGVNSMNIRVDLDGGGTSDVYVVYEPYQDVGNAAVLTGVWQDWDAYRGGTARWWINNGAGGCGQSTPCTWSTIVTTFPNATIREAPNCGPGGVVVPCPGSLGVNQGSFNAGFISNADALYVSIDGRRVTYDFEPAKGGKQSGDDDDHEDDDDD